MSGRHDSNLPPEAREDAPTDDGGPAFPNVEYLRAGDRERGTTVGGMTLRDYFAAHAPLYPFASFPEESEIERMKAVANIEAAWRGLYADAMLKARK